VSGGTPPQGVHTFSATPANAIVEVSQFRQEGFRGINATRSEEYSSKDFGANSSCARYGRNYFVPVDAQISNAAEVPIPGVRISDLTKPLAALPTKVNIIVLDAPVDLDRRQRAASSTARRNSAGPRCRRDPDRRGRGAPMDRQAPVMV
jgi:hypothetical protein